jgi:hypothetical protein
MQGEAVMEYGMRAGRRRKSQILLVMAMDHIDPPVREQVRRIVLPGMQTTITNRRQWFGTIDIRRRLILFEGPAPVLSEADLCIEGNAPWIGSRNVLHHGDAPCVFGVGFSRICEKNRSLFLTGGPMNVDTDRTDQGGGTGNREKGRMR